MPDLLPCPFCGTEPTPMASVDTRPEYKGHVHGVIVRCDECGIEMGDEYKEDVFDRWNTRHEGQSNATTK